MTGISPLVRDQTAIVFHLPRSLDAVEPLGAEDTRPLPDDSSGSRRFRLFIEALLRLMPLPHGELRLTAAGTRIADDLLYQRKPARQALANLLKLLLASLYTADPTVPRRNAADVPVGTVIAGAGRVGAAGIRVPPPGSGVRGVGAAFRSAAISRLRGSAVFWTRMRAGGIWWWRRGQLLEEFAPAEQVVGERFQWAMQLVPQALNEILGEGRWRAEPHEYNGEQNHWIKAVGPIQEAEECPPTMSRQSDPVAMAPVMRIGVR